MPTNALPPFFTPAAYMQTYIDHMLSPSAPLFQRRRTASCCYAPCPCTVPALDATDALPDLPAAGSTDLISWSLVRPTDAPESDPTDTSLFWSYSDQNPHQYLVTLAVMSNETPLEFMWCRRSCGPLFQHDPRYFVYFIGHRHAGITGRRSVVV
jgi:hypothetical protein